MLTLSDRIFLATLATLFLLVLVLEWNSRRLSGVPQHVLPPIPGSWNLQNTNIPPRRGGCDVVMDVGYIDVDDAAFAGNE